MRAGLRPSRVALSYCLSPNLRLKGTSENIGWNRGNPDQRDSVYVMLCVLFTGVNRGLNEKIMVHRLQLAVILSFPRMEYDFPSRGTRIGVRLVFRLRMICCSTNRTTGRSITAAAFCALEREYPAARAAAIFVSPRTTPSAYFRWRCFRQKNQAIPVLARGSPRCAHHFASCLHRSCSVISRIARGGKAPEHRLFRSGATACFRPSLFHRCLGFWLVLDAIQRA